MGQDQIQDFLIEHPNEWFTARQVADHLGLSNASASTCLVKLRQSHDVYCEYEVRPKQYKYRPERGI